MIQIYLDTWYNQLIIHTEHLLLVDNDKYLDEYDTIIVEMQKMIIVKYCLNYDQDGFISKLGFIQQYESLFIFIKNY